MKKVKKIISLLAASAMLLVASFGSNTLTVEAAEPVTYTLQYDFDDDDWRFQVGYPWDDTAEHRELYYMEQAIKDGDIIVVEGENSNSLNLNLNITLSNVTLSQSDFVCIGANRIDNVYVTGDSSGSFSGYVDHAYVYNYGIANFNNDVGTLEVQSNENDIRATVGVAGTCAHLYATASNGATVMYDLYSFRTGSLHMSDGMLNTAESNYSKTPGAISSATQATASTTTSTSSSAASSEYDDVPKTGESNLTVWLFGIATISFVGSLALRRKSN